MYVGMIHFVLKVHSHINKNMGEKGNMETDPFLLGFAISPEAIRSKGGASELSPVNSCKF